MYQRSQHCALVAAMVLVGAPVRAQSAPSVPVNVQPAGAVQIVLVSSNAAEKVLTTTDQKGQGSIDGAVVAKLGSLDMIEESCGSRKRVLLVASNGKVADRAGCSKRSIGTFVSGTDRTLKAELFTPLPRPATIPDPAQAKPSTPPIQPAESAPSSQKPTAAITSAPAGACPSGAGLIGPKLDLPEGGKTFEEAPLLRECAYRGLKDVESGQWIYYKVSLVNGQVLKVTARTRDTYFYPRQLYLRLHGPNGGRVGDTSSNESSTILELQYKAGESGFAYLAVADVVGGTALQISIQ